MQVYYLTTKEIADHFKVSTATIKKWRSEGMPFTQISRTIRYDIDKINKWIKLGKNNELDKAKN